MRNREPLYKAKKVNKDEISIREFRKIITGLKTDDPKSYLRTSWRNQKDHWLGWLDGYFGPGAYNRKNWNRDARYVYNHVVCPELLIYLIRNLGLPQKVVQSAEEAYVNGSTLMATSGAIRKVVPWEMIYPAIKAKIKLSLFDRIKTKIK